MNKSVSGFYHDPPLWIGGNPISHNSSKVDFNLFDKVVVKRSIASNLEICVRTEGLIAFNFDGWPTPHRAEDKGSEPTGFDILADTVIGRTYVMNAYLALFYSRQIVEDNFSQDRMVVMPELTISMDTLESNSSQSFGNDRVSHLALSRFVGTYNPSLPAAFDSRLSRRGGPVSTSVAEHAAQDLSDLIAKGQAGDLLLLDLFLRASKAYQDHNHSLSLITYWAIIEKLINVLWGQLLSDNQYRNEKVFIDGARKKRLMDGRTFSASVMSEMLSFSELMANDIYTDVALVRKARNDWMHDLKPVVPKDAERAGSVCEKLLKQVKDVVVRSATGRRIHG